MQRYLVCEGTEPAGGTTSAMLLLPHKEIGLFIAFNCYGQGAAKVQPTGCCFSGGCFPPACTLSPVFSLAAIGPLSTAACILSLLCIIHHDFAMPL